MKKEEVKIAIENNDIKTLDMLATKNWLTKMELLSMDNCPIKYIEQLSNDEDGLVKQYVAKHPNCPKEILEYFAKTIKDENMTYKIVANPNVSEEALNIISKNLYQTEDVFRIMVLNKNCSENVLVTRSLYASKYVLDVIKEHPNCPNYLEKILNMNDKELVELAATTPNEKEMKFLFEKGSLDMYDQQKGKIGFDIMDKLLDNPNLSNDLKNEIGKYDSYLESKSNRNVDLEDKYGYVYDRELILQNHNIEREVIDELSKYDKDKSIMELILENKQCSSQNIIDIYNNLENKESLMINLEISNHPLTPSYILDELSKNENESIRYNVSKNINTSIKTLESLCYDKGTFVVENIINNPNVTPKILERIFYDNLDFDERLYEITRNINCPVSILEKVSIEDDYKDENILRFNVINNPNVTKEILNELTKDLNVSNEATDKLLEVIRNSDEKDVQVFLQKVETLSNDLYIKLDLLDETYIQEELASRNDVPISLLNKYSKDLSNDTLRELVLRRIHLATQTHKHLAS